MQGEKFECAGDEPLFVIPMVNGYGFISQANERGKLESIGTSSQRLRAMADYLDGITTKNTEPN
ncbi:MAG: hypothetical protein EOP84_29325 [Verrucomicrobiaceae bacterium]|nr:MAG: hypothetical protein EOP84_29325 [Verrucomicrobiaceae bacterium]